MQAEVVPIHDEAQCQQLAAFLADRIYEFNATATGYFDGMLLAGCIRTDAGEIIAASKAIHRDDAANSRMFGYTSSTEGEDSEHSCFVLPKPRL